MRSLRSRKPARYPAGFRHGFTLIEMLVVIFVLLILTVLAFAVVGADQKHERITGASRHLRSFLEGARDRAIHSRRPRGVRLLIDASDLSPQAGVFTRMVYIGPAGNLSQGAISVSRRRITSTPPIWNQLWRDGLIPDGSRITIRDNVYTIVRFPPPRGGGNGRWELTRNLIGRGGRVSYELELAPMELPGQEPRGLEGNVVIRAFTLGGAFSRARSLDIMFSQRGTIIGTAARQGHIHMLVTGYEDRNLPPGSDRKEDNEILVSVKTQNGSVSAHSVVPGDVFRNAETGVETE